VKPISIAALLVLLLATCAFAQPVRVLIITGGHAHDISFYSIFENFEPIRATTDTLEDALKSDLRKRFDVLVMYDMHNEISEAARTNLRNFVEAGKGIVSLHHAVVNFTAWPWWYEEVTGGKYFIQAVGQHGASANTANAELVVRPVGKHPVTDGVGELRVSDEPYRKMWFSPKIKVLMETDHSLNDKPVVYVGPYDKARVVYIQLGHDRRTHLMPGYQKLVRNAILWAAGKTD